MAPTTDNAWEKYVMDELKRMKEEIEKIKKKITVLWLHRHKKNKEMMI